MKVTITLPDEYVALVDDYLAFVKIWGNRGEFLRDAIRFRLENAASFKEFCKERDADVQSED